MWISPLDLTCTQTFVVSSEKRVETEAQRAFNEHTNGRVVLDAQINVLLDAEAEGASLGEVALLELVLLHLQATVEDLLGLGAAHGAVARDLLVTTDAEGADGVAGLEFNLKKYLIKIKYL